MRKVLGLTGKKINKLTVIKRVENNKHQQSMWLCSCDCGIEKIIHGSSIVSGLTKSCGCLRRAVTNRRAGFFDLTGKKFNKLTVIKKNGNVCKHGEHSKWICECDCGNIVTVIGSNIVNHNTSTCGCGKKLPTGEAGFNSLYNRYVKGANTRQLKWLLSKDQVRNITSSNCHYCGDQPSVVNDDGGRANGSYVSNGIDRINSDKGYHINNVVTCCWPCNKAKGNMGYSQFNALIAKIYHNLKLH